MLIVERRDEWSDEEFDDTIFRFIQEQSLLTPGNRVLIACSGGVDSMALLHFFAAHREKLEIEVAAVHVDHMLRGEESAQTADLSSDFVTSLGFLFLADRYQCRKYLKKKEAMCKRFAAKEDMLFLRK